MLNSLIDKINNASTLAILGFGREGKSTYNFIRRYLKDKKIYILDANEIVLDDEFAIYKKYNNTLDELLEYDLIIKTPGISFKDIDVSKIKDKITSQMELMLEVYRDNVIGITGTKGKSTTSTLLYNVFKDQGIKSYLVGNIGVPVLDNIEEYNDAIIIAEMSSHQLEFVNTSPHIGIVLNLFQDHLDHAGSVKHYHECKMNMLKYQQENDYGIYDLDNYYLKEITNNLTFKSNILNVSLNDKTDIYLDNENIVLNNNILIKENELKRNILGNHNLKNILFVLLVSSIYKLDFNKVFDTISKFNPLEHRMEYVGTFNNITFYNDSIATIPEATINACETLKDVDTLIFGGQDRGIDYKELINYLNKSNINNFICMPSTGYKLAEYLDQNKVHKIDNLEDAVVLAYKLTEKNKICLLSPSAPSYEFYKNFEEKGRAYKEFIDKHKFDI